jgi:hypothetical protein
MFKDYTIIDWDRRGNVSQAYKEEIQHGYAFLKATTEDPLLMQGKSDLEITAKFTREVFKQTNGLIKYLGEMYGDRYPQEVIVNLTMICQYMASGREGRALLDVTSSVELEEAYKELYDYHLFNKNN